MVSVLCDKLWYCFTTDLYKYVSKNRQGQYAKQLGATTVPRKSRQRPTLEPSFLFSRNSKNINPTAWSVVPAYYYLRTCTDLL
jgi:hypothetical protein